jgi:hypothetical protein
MGGVQDFVQPCSMELFRNMGSFHLWPAISWLLLPVPGWRCVVRVWERKQENKPKPREHVSMRQVRQSGSHHNQTHPIVQIHGVAKLVTSLPRETPSRAASPSNITYGSAGGCRVQGKVAIPWACLE